VKTAFRNKNNARALVEFSGLRYGNKMPTDIDAFLDFDNKAFVFFEVKYRNADMSYGQQLALERLCDSVNPDIEAYVLVVSHTTKDGDIDLASSIITKIRHGGKWMRPARKNATVKEFVDWLYRRVYGKN
jgi:hypothetical protein